MKLVCREKSGNMFETDLPRIKTKHRIPQVGTVVNFYDGNKKFSGEVLMVEHNYTQILGGLQKTEVVVSLNEI